MNLGFYNNGDYAANETIGDGVVALIVDTELKTAFRKYDGGIKFPPGTSAGSLPAYTKKGIYRTFYSRTLNAEDAEALNTGKKALLVLYKARWSDDTGRYESVFAQIYLTEQPPNRGVFNWRALPENGRERKLQ